MAKKSRLCGACRTNIGGECPYLGNNTLCPFAQGYEEGWSDCAKQNKKQ